MQIDWIHRAGDGPGTLNLCFNALDRHVVRGHADTVALDGDRPWSYARLLEEVAAFGGALRAFGIGQGDAVVARLPQGRDALVALLASMRLGAVHTLEATDAENAAVALADAVIRRSGTPGPDDLDWDLVLRAGRTDPAACAELPETADALVVDGRRLTLGEVLEERVGWPYDALATLLGGGTVELGA